MKPTSQNPTNPLAQILNTTIGKVLVAFWFVALTATMLFDVSSAGAVGLLLQTVCFVIAPIMFGIYLIRSVRKKK